MADLFCRSPERLHDSLMFLVVLCRFDVTVNI